MTMCCQCFADVDREQLHRDGWGQLWDVCRACVIRDAKLFGNWRPCPSCQLRHGFHDREYHERIVIPADKLIARKVAA